jgi:hypothetical protein
MCLLYFDYDHYRLKYCLENTLLSHVFYTFMFNRIEIKITAKLVCAVFASRVVTLHDRHFCLFYALIGHTCDPQYGEAVSETVCSDIYLGAESCECRIHAHCRDYLCLHHPR